MLTGYRTYVAALALLLHQFLKSQGFDTVTGEQISTAIDVLCVICVVLFRFLATRKSKANG